MKAVIIGQDLLPIPDRMCNCNVFNINSLKKVNLLNRCLRALCIRFNLKQKYRFYNIDDIVKQSIDSDIVILHDSMPKDVLVMISKKIEQKAKPQTKLYFYYWNNVGSRIIDGISKRWEILAFDKKDALNFNIRYVGGFYNYDNCDNSEIASNPSKLFFAGTNGGRFQSLRKLEKLLKKQQYDCNFKYVSPLGSFFNPFIYSRPFSYSTIVKFTLNSKAIVEWMKSGQVGLTLRSYEALFFNRKLITNNKYIKNYNFYDPSYIFIYESEESIKHLEEFLLRPIDVGKQSYFKKQYSYERWFKTVIEGKQNYDV